MKRLLALLAPLFVVACASAAEAPSAPPSSALDVLRSGGTYGFVLDESDPAARFRAECEAKCAGDAAGAAACYEAIREVASHEGIRFSVDPAGRLVWTSFGVEDGQPVTYLEANLDASLEKENVVRVTLAEPARGLQVKDKPLPPDHAMRFQVVDPRTVVMVDPTRELSAARTDRRTQSLPWQRSAPGRSLS